MYNATPTLYKGDKCEEGRWAETSDEREEDGNRTAIAYIDDVCWGLPM